jgi:hypothetical protein
MTDELFPDFNAETVTPETPCATAFLAREGESVWIFAFPSLWLEMHYPAVAIADDSMPVGVVFSWPAADLDALMHMFDRERVRHIRDGWQYRSVTRVWSGDPWDAPDPLTQPCPF